MTGPDVALGRALIEGRDAVGYIKLIRDYYAALDAEQRTAVPAEGVVS
jgi:hypothetical protein